MVLLRNSLIVLAMLCAIGAAASIALANDSNGISCLADENGNGFIDKAEVIAMIVAYFDETPCVASDPTPADDPSDWTVSLFDGEPTYYLLSKEQTGSAWWLMLGCSTSSENPLLFMGRVWGVIYDRETDGDESVLVNIDGISSEQQWYYSPRTDFISDVLGSRQPGLLIEKLIEANEVTFTIPSTGDGRVITFSVSGLDQHISAPSDVCQTNS